MKFLSPVEQRAVQMFKDRVCQQLGGQVVDFTLFGSRARGESHEDSDVDILVRMTSAPTALRGAIFEIAADILVEYDVDISPLVMSEAQYRSMLARERLLPQEIERDGVPL